jgi:hypothetical protein
MSQPSGCTFPSHPALKHLLHASGLLGEAAERRGDLDQALAAYRTLRSAFYGTRWLQQPGADWISRCNKKIAALVPMRKGNQP